MIKYLLVFIYVCSLISCALCQTNIGEKFDITLYSNNSTNTLNNQNVFIKILGISKDSIYFEELHLKKTNDKGQASILIGDGILKTNNLNINKINNYTLHFYVSEEENGIYKHLFSSEISNETPKKLNLILNKHYNTGNNSELISQLPITNKEKYIKKVIFSQKIEDLSEGDVIEVLAEFEATNDLGYNVMLASGVVLCETAEQVRGIEICENNGFNITPSMHHATTNKVGTFRCTKNISKGYINVIVYAASTKAKENDMLEINKDYGRLSVLIFSNNKQ